MPEKTFQGKVVKQVFGPGSKSQHNAVMLITPDDKQLKLRRLGANPFQDETFEKLVGSEIRCTGTTRGSTLIVDNWEEVETDEPANGETKPTVPPTSKPENAVKKQKKS